jgi:uncharacterized delta-60 repeat protein
MLKSMRNRKAKVVSLSTSNLLHAAVSFTVEALESRQLLSAGIGGTVFSDAAGNNTMLPGSGIAGAQVYLDLQGIDKLVAGDPVVTTDANGNYTFTGLAAGNYLVRPVPVAGKVIDAPVYGGKYFVQLSANQVVTGDNFAIQNISTVPNFTVNGQILVSGVSGGQQTLTRYNADTSTDVYFGSLGVVRLPASVTGAPTGATAQGANIVITYPSAMVTLDNSGAIVSIGNTGMTTGPLNAPTNLAAVATSPTSVALTFTDNSTNDTGFVIQRASATSNTYLTVGTIPGSVTGPSTGTVGFTDNSVSPNTIYSYIVYAVNSTNYSDKAGPKDVLTPNLTTAIGATIAGSVYQNDLLKPAVGVQAYLDLQGLGSYVANDPTATTDANGSFTFTGLNAGNYLVRLLPPAGEVVVSPVYGAKQFIQLGANQTVAGVQFAITHYTFAVNGQFLVAQAGFTQPTVTRYLADGETDLSFGNTGTVVLPLPVTGTPSSAVAQGSNTVITYPSSTVTLGPTGAILSIVTNTNPVNAPTGLSARAPSPTTVQVNFTDNSTNDTGFVIERSTSAAGPYGSVGTSAGANSLSGTGAVTFTDNTAQPNTTYFYRVYPANSLSGAIGPVAVTTPSVAVTGASISGTVQGNYGNEQVYLDLQGIEHYVAGDPIVTTDAQGRYAFTGLNAGNYLVRVKPQPGWFTVSPVYGGKYFVQLAANQTVTGDDFGVQALPSFALGNQFLAYSVAATTGNNVLERFNADESTDVTFGSRNALGTVTLPSTVTGTPSSAVVQPNGNIIVTYPGNVVTLGSDGTILSIVPTAVGTASISGTVYTDDNLDGIMENIIPREFGVAGRQVYLDLQNTGFYVSSDPTATTDTNGLYTFATLPAGTYTVRLVPQAGSLTTSPAARDYVVSLANGQAVTGDDFGTQKILLTQTDGKLLASGLVNANAQNPFDTLVLRRFNPDGTLDPTFGTNGVTASLGNLAYQGFSTVTSIQPSPKGSLAVYLTTDNSRTSTTNYSVVLMTANGQIITSIPLGQISNAFPQTNIPPSVAGFQTDGKLLVAGVYHFSQSDAGTAVTRFNIDGTLDTTFASNGTLVLPNLVGAPTGVYGSADGLIHISFANDTVTVSSTGVLDSARVLPVASNVVATPITPTDVVIQFVDNATTETSYVIQSSLTGTGNWKNEGEVLGSPATGPRLFTVSDALPGTLTYYRLLTVNNAVRSDPSQVVTATTSSNTPTTVVLSSGKTVAAAAVTPSPGFLDLYVTRTNPDGTADNTFGTSGRVKLDSVLVGDLTDSSSINQILVKPDGSLVVLELQGHFGSNTNGYISQLFLIDSNGNITRQTFVESSRAVGAQSGPVVDRIALTADGKVLAVSKVYNNTGNPPPFREVSRFNADFTPDPTFGNVQYSGVGATRDFYGTNIGSLDAPDGIGQLPDGNVIVPFGDHAVLLSNTGVVLPPGFNAPSNLTAAAITNAKVHVQFMDNAVNETGFFIERKVVGSNIWSRVPVTGLPALDGTGVVQFDDTTVSPSTSYDYRVFAVNGSLRTGNSADVIATTTA